MENLKTWRNGKGLSLEEAGKLIGVSGVQWHRYEIGTRRVLEDKIPAITAVTGIPAEELRPDLAALFASSTSKQETAA